MLREGGTFVAKFFKGADLSYLDVMMKQLFKDVYVVKPESSRSSSAEAFVIGIGYYSGKELTDVLSGSMMGLKDNMLESSEQSQIKEAANPEDEEDALTF